MTNDNKTITDSVPGKKIASITVRHVLDSDPDLTHLGRFGDNAEEFHIECGNGRDHYQFFNAANVENQDQARENYERVLKFESGDLHAIAIRAEAMIMTSLDGKTWLANTVRSGSIFGIESDSEPSFIKELEANELTELFDVLKLLGFEPSKTPIKFKGIDDDGDGTEWTPAEPEPAFKVLHKETGNWSGFETIEEAENDLARIKKLIPQGTHIIIRNDKCPDCKIPLTQGDLGEGKITQWCSGCKRDFGVIDNSDDGFTLMCPYCLNHKDEGHTNDCERPR